MTQFESQHLSFLAHTNLLQALMNGEVQKPKEAKSRVCGGHKRGKGRGRESCNSTPHLLSQRGKSLISSLIFTGNVIYVRRINSCTGCITEKVTHLCPVLSEQRFLISQTWTEIKSEQIGDGAWRSEDAKETEPILCLGEHTQAESSSIVLKHTAPRTQKSPF